MGSLQKRIIGITLGDPGGIGPEVIATCMAKPSIRNRVHFLIIGDWDAYRRYASPGARSIQFADLKCIKASDMPRGKPTAVGAKASLAYIDHALGLIKNKQMHALVTGPVCKETISGLGRTFPGHTEYIADYFNIKKFGMMFVARNLKTVVVTRHMPLAAVSAHVTQKSIETALTLTTQSLKTYFKIPRPVIAVCGLNPHAGEGGAIGKEELTVIKPAINRFRKKNIGIVGPLPADTVFHPALARRYDAIVAMYHDQGLIALKALYFNELVNLTIGLPFIRTSPAHGTAFTIAGKNKANPSSMRAALCLAASLTE